jgi:pimeloyl-ACP methyl ester carboxylesterase
MPADTAAHAEFAEFTEHAVEAAGFSLRYWRGGHGTPVVFLHGAGGPAISPAHQMLAGSHEVIIFEMPGFGASPRNDRTGTISELAEVMREAAAAACEPPYALAGTSFGSRVASWMAVQDPAAVSVLVLLSPTGLLPDGFAPPSAAAMTNGIAQLYAHPETARPLIQLDAETAGKHAELVGRLLTPRDAELEAAYRTLATPTLLAFGTADRRTPVDLAHRYVELNRAFTVIFVYDAGHVLDEERPEAVSDLIAEFIARGAGIYVNRRSGRLFA